MKIVNEPVVMTDHNPEYTITPDGKIFDTVNKVYVEAIENLSSDYPIVRMRNVGKGGNKTSNLPYLICYYFMKDFTSSLTLSKKNESKPWTLENIRTSFARSRNRFNEKDDDDNGFFDWNDTALYC